MALRTTSPPMLWPTSTSRLTRTGHAATIAISGVTNVLVAGAITAGDSIKVDANGKAAKATLPADAALVKAIAIGTSTGADQLIPALLV